MIARAQIEQWWVSGDGVGGLWWVGITGTSDKESAHHALLIEQNVALFREFPAHSSLLITCFICVIRAAGSGPGLLLMNLHFFFNFMYIQDLKRDKNDRRNSGGTLRHKFNLIDI